MAIAEIPSVTYSNPLDIIELRHKRRESALSQLAAAAERQGVVRDLETLVAALARRERLGTTALGKGVALLHARSVGVVRPYWLIGRSTKGLDWSAPDGEPVQLVVLYLSHHEQSPPSHLHRLSVAAQALRQQRTRQRLMTTDPATALALLQGSGCVNGVRPMLELHDLDQLLMLLRDPDTSTQLRRIGYALDGEASLVRDRDRLVATLERRWLGWYERSLGRYGRGVTLVRSRVCQGCFMTLPTSAAPPPGEAHLHLCENCGRLLFWS